MKRYLVVGCLITSLVVMTGCSIEEELGIERTTGTGLTITKEKYNRIKNGDSYSTVKSILGGSCENYYSNGEEDWYTCIDNKDSSKRIVLKFEKGKMTRKSSSGLN